MPFHTETHRLAEFTLLKVTGPASMQDFTALISSFSESTRHDGDKRVLVDLLGVEGGLKFTDHFQLGQLVAQHLRHLDRLASVVPEDQITRTSEKVAVKQGMQLRVFTSMNQAIRWLGETHETASLPASGERLGA